MKKVNGRGIVKRVKNIFGGRKYRIVSEWKISLRQKEDEAFIEMMSGEWANKSLEELLGPPIRDSALQQIKEILNEPIDLCDVWVEHSDSGKRDG